MEKKELSIQEKEACRLVENLCRSLGRDCQVIFGRQSVSVAPAKWAGDSSGNTLAEALHDALQQER